MVDIAALNNAINKVKLAVEQAQPLLEIRDALELVAQAEQLVAEAEVRRRAVEKEIEKAHADLDETIREAQQKAQEMEAEARDRAEREYTAYKGDLLTQSVDLKKEIEGLTRERTKVKNQLSRESEAAAKKLSEIDVQVDGAEKTAHEEFRVLESRIAELNEIAAQREQNFQQKEQQFQETINAYVAEENRLAEIVAKLQAQIRQLRESVASL